MLDKWQWKNSLNYSQSRYCSGSRASSRHVMVHLEIHAYKIQSPLCSAHAEHTRCLVKPLWASGVLVAGNDVEKKRGLSWPFPPWEQGRIYQPVQHRPAASSPARATFKQSVTVTSAKDQHKSKPDLLKREGSHLNQPSASSGPDHLKT